MAGSLRSGVLPVLARTEQNKIASDNLCAIFLFPALPVLPTRGLQLAFNVELRSFPDVLAYDLRQPLPSHNAVPFCSVLPLIVPVLEAFVRGQTDPRDRNAARRVLHFRVLADIADQNDLIHALRHVVLQLLCSTSIRSCCHIPRSDNRNRFSPSAIRRTGRSVHLPTRRVGQVPQCCFARAAVRLNSVARRGFLARP